jgi:hypothetical protein
MMNAHHQRIQIEQFRGFVSVRPPVRLDLAHLVQNIYSLEGNKNSSRSGCFLGLGIKF